MPSLINPDLMARAIALSRLGYPAPNPHVGCVIERDGEVVGEGFHDHAGGPHAEVVALGAAGPNSRGATAYVTLEPCNHQGRTGPCTLALIEAGVARVVIAVMEPNPLAGGGALRLRESGIEVIDGEQSAEAESVNLPWLTATRRRWPFVVAKAAVSLDGRMALANGNSKWITGESARRQAHVLRAECGAVLVGKNTVENDDPELTVRHIEVVNQPLRIVLDVHRELSANHRIFADSNFVRVVANAEQDCEIQVNLLEGRANLVETLRNLYSRGTTSLLVEGGAMTISSFLKDGLVDRLELFVAPKILGAGPTWVNHPGPTDVNGAPQLRYENERLLGDDLWITALPVVGPSLETL